MRRPLPSAYGHIYQVDGRRFAIGTDEPRAALALTSDEWNGSMGSATCAFVYRRPASTRERDVAIGDDYFVDCSHLFPVPHGFVDANDPWDPITAAQMGEVKNHLWGHLSLQAALDEVVDPDRPVPMYSAWFPNRGEVHGVAFPENMRHGFAIVSSAEVNESNGTSSGLMLTSSDGKPRRAKWEVTVPGGCVVPGDVYTFANDDFGVQVRGLPKALSATELHNSADTLISVLNL